MTSSRDLIRQAKRSSGAVSAEPGKRLAIVTCMDARIDPFRIYKIRRGEAHVIRNAGGLVDADVMRSLLISQYRLGTTAIDVMMHTDCGMQGLRDSDMNETIAGATGQAQSLEFGGFDDLTDELRRAVRTLHGAEALPHRDRVRGLVYDVDASRLTVVVNA